MEAELENFLDFLNMDNAIDQFERSLSVKSHKTGFKTLVRDATAEVYPLFTFNSKPQLQLYTFYMAHEDSRIGYRHSLESTYTITSKIISEIWLKKTN